MSSRKQLLLESALTLFIEHGVANTTIQMILDKSVVSKGTFYKFFNSKDDCLQAILEQRMQEDIAIRKNLENDHYASEYDLLVDQISIPMTLPERERVWELYWTGFYSGEINSSNLANMQLKWLSERLTQLYGEEIRPYASEGSIFFYGMLHQIANAWRSFHGQKPVWNELVPKVLSYVEVLLHTMHERKEHILDPQTLALFHPSEFARTGHVDKEALLEELHDFNKMIQKSNESTKLKEISKGLLALFQAQDELNVSLIEIVVKALQKEFESSKHRTEASQIARSCWWFLEQIKV
ncbi:TetR/AcrR family transcriptional regulator [Paenibacillus sp. Leaf72]|uniref:TetR/AcrR family transcriptional regulator n=1 Tax=Paenibacillus sp. Leaf72 TaxID=1736234 RepID=UPI0006F70DFB|nr:TetR/AcrR family transcriptional regulator [Paenibacillus sp. Leaf72]KQO17560.1 TetR family transcriptional regulator [Paenibacillus sp. Leaf72]